MDLICLVVIVLGIACIGIWMYEKSKFNNGVCKINNKIWILQKFDDSGSRLYRAGEQFLWITLPFIDGR